MMEEDRPLTEDEALEVLSEILGVLCRGYGPLTVINAVVKAIMDNPRNPKLKF